MRRGAAQAATANPTLNNIIARFTRLLARFRFCPKIRAKPKRRKARIKHPSRSFCPVTSLQAQLGLAVALALL
jgi:hypothetical protein